MGRGLGRAVRGRLHVRQILVDLPAARARRRGAARPQARCLFPLGGTLGDDRGRGARTGSACGVAHRQRLRAILLRRCRARGGDIRHHAARGVRLSRRLGRLCRAAARDPLAGGAPEPCCTRRHGLAAKRLAAARYAAARGGRVLGDAAAAGRDRAVLRAAAHLAVVDVGVVAAAGDAAVVAAGGGGAAQCVAHPDVGGRAPDRDGGCGSGHRLCHPSRGPAGRRQPRLAAGWTDRDALERDDRSAAEAVLRRRRLHRWRVVLRAEPSGGVAGARRRAQSADRAADRPRGYCAALPGADARAGRRGALPQYRDAANGAVSRRQAKGSGRGAALSRRRGRGRALSAVRHSAEKLRGYAFSVVTRGLVPRVSLR